MIKENSKNFVLKTDFVLHKRDKFKSWKKMLQKVKIFTLKYFWKMIITVNTITNCDYDYDLHIIFIFIQLTE